MAHAVIFCLMTGPLSIESFTLRWCITDDLTDWQCAHGRECIVVECIPFHLVSQWCTMSRLVAFVFSQRQDSWRPMVTDEDRHNLNDWQTSFGLPWFDQNRRIQRNFHGMKEDVFVLFGDVCPSGCKIGIVHGNHSRKLATFSSIVLSMETASSFMRRGQNSKLDAFVLQTCFVPMVLNLPPVENDYSVGGVLSEAPIQVPFDDCPEIVDESVVDSELVSLHMPDAHAELASEPYL